MTTFTHLPRERIEIMLLFLENPGKPITAGDIITLLSIEKDASAGRVAGGILSSIYRKKINNKDFIKPLEPEMSTRRMKWVLNTIDFNEQKRNSLKKELKNVLDTRNQLLGKTP